MSIHNEHVSTADPNVSIIKATETISNEEIEITIQDKVRIANGGWATVYRAKLSPSGETIAIKEARERQRYRHRELELMRLIPPDENIIRLRYCAVKPDPEEDTTQLLTLFMDYLPTNLEHLIQDHANGMEMSLIQVYSKQLFSGLAHLSSLDIAHRDLHPRNILIDPIQQKLKLADFGCAKVVSPDIPNYPKVGTWQYRAVELLFGATRYGPKADVWSIGVVILEMTSGKYPFPVEAEDAMLESVLTFLGPITIEQVRDMGVDPLLYPELLARSTFDARRWSDIQVVPKTPSVELHALLNQCLEYSPHRRSDAATLLEHKFFNTAGEQDGGNTQEQPYCS